MLSKNEVRVPVSCPSRLPNMLLHRLRKPFHVHWRARTTRRPAYPALRVHEGISTSLEWTPQKPALSLLTPSQIITLGPFSSLPTELCTTTCYNLRVRSTLAPRSIPPVHAAIVRTLLSRAPGTKQQLHRQEAACGRGFEVISAPVDSDRLVCVEWYRCSPKLFTRR